MGDFSPSIIKTKDYEFAIKKYTKSDFENSHMHKIAYEITAIISGKVRINDMEYVADDIIYLAPGEVINFEVLTDEVVTAVLKAPSIIGDKYTCGDAKND